jgi:hypothetical protein
VIVPSGSSAGRGTTGQPDLIYHGLSIAESSGTSTRDRRARHLGDVLAAVAASGHHSRHSRSIPDLPIFIGPMSTWPALEFVLDNCPA